MVTGNREALRSARDADGTQRRQAARAARRAPSPAGSRHGRRAGSCWRPAPPSWYAALPRGRREMAQDSALALALAVLNLLSLLPYQSQLHPLLGWPLSWSAAQCLPLALRRRLAGAGADLLGRAAGPLRRAEVRVRAAAARARHRVRHRRRAQPPGDPLDHRHRRASAESPTRRRCPGTTSPTTRSSRPPSSARPGRSARSAGTAGPRWPPRRVARRPGRGLARRRRRRAAAAAERGRIARELHDVVAHHVSLIAVQAEAVGRAAARPPGRGVRVGRRDRGDRPRRR